MDLDSNNLLYLSIELFFRPNILSKFECFEILSNEKCSIIEKKFKFELRSLIKSSLK